MSRNHLVVPARLRHAGPHKDHRRALLDEARSLADLDELEAPPEPEPVQHDCSVECAHEQDWWEYVNGSDDE